MTTEHRKAPRRSVVAINRLGNWGAVRYEHKLECGHIEIRPRASTAPKLACVGCLKAKAFSSEIEALVKKNESNQIIEIDENYASNESLINSIRASIASYFKVDSNDVDVICTDINGELKIQCATVFLSSPDVYRISHPTMGRGNESSYQ